MPMGLYEITNSVISYNPFLINAFFICSIHYFLLSIERDKDFRSFSRDIDFILILKSPPPSIILDGGLLKILIRNGDGKLHHAAHISTAL